MSYFRAGLLLLKNNPYLVVGPEGLSGLLEDIFAPILLCRGASGISEKLTGVHGQPWSQSVLDA
jgi:hypothetical protein